MRTLHKLYANLFGYFWLPCPVCGRMFGGHEIAGMWTADLIGEDGLSRAVCPDPRSMDGLERIPSPDDCCRWCKSGWCTKHGTCEHEIPTVDDNGNHAGIGCALAL